MSPHDPFRLTRTAIRICRERGYLHPLRHRAAARFRALARAELAPQFQQFANVLCQEGLDVSADIALDNDPPTLQLFLAYPALSLCLHPTEEGTVILTVQHGTGATPVTHITLCYEDIAHGGCLLLIQKYMIQAFASAAPPF